ncbi:hypothetical protein HZC53_02430 [Candidatus Uhrbacteria bacterium]|nr:hypothetical protein [Candidatus Uhrbacteria bacterium]
MPIKNKVSAVIKFPLIVAVGLCGAVWLHLFSRCIAQELARRNPQSAT